MSGPVPSPSMKGMIGRSGTVRRPSLCSIAWPSCGIFGAALAMVNLRARFYSTSVEHQLAAAEETDARISCAVDRDGRMTRVHGAERRPAPIRLVERRGRLQLPGVRVGEPGRAGRVDEDRGAAGGVFL